MSISFRPRRQAGDVDDAVGDQMADFVVMDNGDHGDALALLLGDQLDHDGAVGGVERGGRLVQQQDRQVRDEAARDVDALLLAAGEGRGRQLPEALGDVEAMQQLAGARLRVGSAPCRSRSVARRRRRCVGNPRHRPQKLADIADGGAADVEHLPRLGGGEIDHRAAMADADAAGVAAVIAEDHLQDRRFAGAGRAGQHDAFARC